MLYYDFSTDFSENYIQELEPLKPQPTPDQEIQRSKVLDELSNYLKELLREHLQMDYIPTMFSRWLFLQIATKNPTTEDPILRRPEVVFDDKKNTIRDVIIDNFPVSTYIPWTGPKSRSNISAIKKTVKNWIRKISTTYKEIEKDENFQKIRELVEPCRERVEHEDCLTSYSSDNEQLIKPKRLITQENPDVLYQNFRKLKNSLKPKIDDLLSPKVEILFEKLVKKTKELLKKIPSNEQDYSVYDGDVEKEVTKKNTVVISFQDIGFTITKEHYEKLSKLFIEERSRFSLDTSIWILLKRYSKFICDPEDKSEQFHAAAPKNFFELVKKQYNVSFECFASPLNCYFKNFCSAFVDTDGCFGSKGSFFYFKPTQGAFEVNPPYIEEVIEYTADHIIDLLNNSSRRPLFFIIGAPDWREPLQKGQEKIEDCKFLKGQFVLEGKKYEYISGGQYKCLRTFNMPFANRFYLLQNDAASKRLQINQEGIDKLKKSFEIRK